MLSAIVHAMVYLGSALMVYNIYRYIRFAGKISQQGGWAKEERLLTVPIVLLILFLLGYLAVGLFGAPDLIIGGILFGGSVFVFLMIIFMEQVILRVQENERLEARLTSAEESSRAKTSFLSRISHEMRTPMNAIIGLNSIALKDPEISDKTRDYLEKMRISTQHMMELINDTLEMGRIESGKDELLHEEFSLKELVKTVNSIFEAQCTEKGLTYDYELKGSLEPAYLGDALKLKQIFVNILSNAVKFTPAPGRIRFSVEHLSSYGGHRTVRFIISDTGIGMDKDFLPKLFQVFTQEDATTTNRYGGTGLGMAITKNLIDQMNGDIQVQSEKGEGSIFTVTVTLDAAAQAAVSASEAPPETQTEPEAEAQSQPRTGEEPDYSVLDGSHVLVAEDIDINAEILFDLLDMEGISAERAENGQQAVELFRESEPGEFDTVLMDIRMPVMDGLAAAKAIRSLDREDAKSVPIIALTANAFQEDVQRSLQAGMNAHLSKPVDPDELFETMIHCRQLRSS